MSAESSEVLYTVILIASTFGSREACLMKRSTLAANESYGWCTSWSPERITASTSRSPSSVSANAGGTSGVQGW